MLPGPGIQAGVAGETFSLPVRHRPIVGPSVAFNEGREEAGPIDVPSSALTRAAESASPSFRRAKAVDESEFDLHDRNDDELSDPIHGLNAEGIFAPVPDRDEHLPLIIGIDEPDQIAQHDTVLVAQTTSGQDNRRQPGVGQVEGDSGRDQLSFTWQEADRFLNARPQVHSRRTRRGVLG